MFFKQKNGFTLIELIITLAILAILTTLALPYFHEIMAKQETIKTTNQTDFKYSVGKITGNPST